METWRLETVSKTSTTNGKDRGPKCRKARSRAEAMERSKVVRAKPAGTDAWAEISWETQGRKGTSALTGFSSLSCRKGDSGFRDDASNVRSPRDTATPAACVELKRGSRFRRPAADVNATRAPPRPRRPGRRNRDGRNATVKSPMEPTGQPRPTPFDDGE